jgi:hypothetical protein
MPQLDIHSWLLSKLEPHEDPTHSFAPRILDILADAIDEDFAGLAAVAVSETREGVLERAIENTSDLIVQLQGDLRRTNQLKSVLETLLKLELGEPDFREGEHVQCIAGHFEGRSGHVLNQDNAYAGELLVKLDPDDAIVGFKDLSELRKIPDSVTLQSAILELLDQHPHPPWEIGYILKQLGKNYLVRHDTVSLALDQLGFHEGVGGFYSRPPAPSPEPESPNADTRPESSHADTHQRIYEHIAKRGVPKLSALRNMLHGAAALMDIEEASLTAAVDEIYNRIAILRDQLAPKPGRPHKTMHQVAVTSLEGSPYLNQNALALLIREGEITRQGEDITYWAMPEDIRDNAFWCSIWRCLRAATAPMTAREISGQVSLGLNIVCGSLRALQNRALVCKVGAHEPAQWTIPE